MEDIRGKDISMIFQEPMSALNPIMTCGKQLVECIITHQNKTFKEAKALAIQWLDKVQLPNPNVLFDRYPHQISGGQKQRLMIAMALCNYPKVLIAYYSIRCYCSKRYNSTHEIFAKRNEYCYHIYHT